MTKVYAAKIRDIDKLDCTQWLDKKSGKVINIMFENEHRLIIDLVKDDDCLDSHTFEI